MPSSSSAQTVFPFAEHAAELASEDRQDTASGWERVLQIAFADPDRHGGFLPQAEQAARAQPGDGHLLLLAATAALLDQEPARAQVFLKRFSKRYLAVGSCHLLRALALAQENKLEVARALLEVHGLTSFLDALCHFPATISAMSKALRPCVSMVAMRHPFGEAASSSRARRRRSLSAGIRGR